MRYSKFHDVQIAIYGTVNQAYITLSVTTPFYF